MTATHEESHASGDVLLRGLLLSRPQRNSNLVFARCPCVRGGSSTAQLRMPPCILAWKRASFCGSVLVAPFKAKTSCQSLCFALSSLAVLGEIGKKKITFLVERRRQHRTAVWPWKLQPPTSQWQGHNIQYCSGESSHRTWRKVRTKREENGMFSNQICWLQQSHWECPAA